MGVIWLFSEQPHSGAMTEKFLGDWNIAVRKLAHMSEYAILFWLVRRALVETARTPRREEIAAPACNGEDCSPVLSQEDASPRPTHNASSGIPSGSIAFVLSVVYALTDEWHQSFVPGRSATIADTLVDAAGAGLGWATLYLAGIIRFRTTSAEKT